MTLSAFSPNAMRGWRSVACSQTSADSRHDAAYELVRRRLAASLQVHETALAEGTDDYLAIRTRWPPSPQRSLAGPHLALTPGPVTPLPPLTLSVFGIISGTSLSFYARCRIWQQG